MTDEAILKALWNEKGANSFPEISIHRIRTIDRDQRKRAQQLLREFTNKPTCPADGIRITQLGSGVYKFIRIDDTPKSSVSPKGLLLNHQNEAVTGESESHFPSADGQNEPSGEKLPGLLCTSTPDLKLPSQKDRASQSLTDWEYQTHSPEGWVALLDAGKTIATGHFVKGRKENYTDENGEAYERWVRDENGEYTHASESWKGTKLVFTDADTFRDENDDAPEPFTDPNKLFELYPSLPKEAYSIGHSISSLSNEKPPPHVRARVAFQLEDMIADPDDYDALPQGACSRLPDNQHRTAACSTGIWERRTAQEIRC